VSAAVGPSGRGRHIVNPWEWQDAFGFVQANVVGPGGRTVYCAGQTSVDAQGTPAHAGDMEAQVGLALDNLETVLAAAGGGLRDVVRLDYLTTDVPALLAAWGPLVGRLADAGCRPASTLAGVEALAFPELMVELEATAVIGA
jgi:enamine deaminase RidA (YjgF/YER057c/UK114 family)